jgi:hypothetical protein
MGSVPSFISCLYSYSSLVFPFKTGAGKKKGKIKSTISNTFTEERELEKGPFVSLCV